MPSSGVPSDQYRPSRPCAEGPVSAFTAALVGALLVLSPAAAEPVSLPLVNGSFEDGVRGWFFPEGCLGIVSTEQAASGTHSLKIVDDSTKAGSNVTAARVPISGAGVYELRWKTFPVSGSGCGLYVRVLAAEGNLVVPGDTYQTAAPSEPRGRWLAASLRLYAPAEALFLELWVHSYSTAVVTCYLDDIELVALGEDALKPPWEPQYKLRPDEKDRLTPADFPGPDGIVYPDWTWAGVPGGIPQVPVRARIEDFGARAGDDRDDSKALARACEEVGEKGGGAVLLGAGVYYLDRPVTVFHDGVVVRGQGPDKTRLIFRYALPASGVTIFTPAPGATVGRNTLIEAHFSPAGLTGWRFDVDGVEVAQAQRGAHWGNTFQARIRGSAVVGKVPDGPHTLRITAFYGDSTREASIPVTVSSTYDGRDDPRGWANAAVGFLGTGQVGSRLRLAADGRRGDKVLILENAEGLAPGDRLFLNGPATDRWKALTRNACPWGDYRQTWLVVERIEDNRVYVNQPLRIEFPVVDGSYVQKTQPLRRCGVEDLYLEQTEDLWISGVIFQNAWECWARNVRVRKCGRFPVYTLNAKWCEIRDCVFDDAWFKGGGGTAYVGFESSCDCLMDGVETFGMRHTPCVQWAASGCVIRRGVFHDSDAQWHSGWTNENLFEQCVVTSGTSTGAYGYGAWASPPEDSAHGPNGPRNVIYNCDFISPKAGLWMGGMNENWLILYNRFVVDNGPGIFARMYSFDHIIRGNVFVLKDGKSPAIQLATPDCTGIEARENVLYGGNGQLTGGPGQLMVAENNRIEALPTDFPPRPTPAVASIFEWERDRR